MAELELIMANAHTKTSGTFIEAVKDSLAAAGRYNFGDTMPPAAILWTDADGEWRPIATRLRALLPELLTLGEYGPGQNRPSHLDALRRGRRVAVVLPPHPSPLRHTHSTNRSHAVCIQCT